MFFGYLFLKFQKNRSQKLLMLEQISYLQISYERRAYELVDDRSVS